MNKMLGVWCVGFEHPSCLLNAIIHVVVPALLGVLHGVLAPMLIAERAVLLCPAFVGLFGVTRITRSRLSFEVSPLLVVKLNIAIDVFQDDQ